MLTQKIVFSYITRLFIQLVQMIVGVVVARIVGPSILGTIAYGLAFVTMFSFIADLGTGTAFIKLKADPNNNSADLLKTYFAIKIILIAIYAILVVSAIYVSEYDHTINISENLLRVDLQVILIYLVIIVLGSLYGIQSTYWSAETKQVRVDLPQITQQFFYQALRLVAALIGFKALGLAVSNLIAAIMVIPIYVYFGRLIRLGTFDKALFYKLIRITGPVILIGIFQVLIFSTDKVILKRLTDENTLGVYSAAFALASFIKSVEAAAGILFFTYIASFIAEKNTVKVDEILTKFYSFFMAFILPGLFLTAIVSDKIILLTYGAEFSDSAKSFSILVFTFGLTLFSLPFGNIIFGSGKYFLSAIIWFFGFLVYIPAIFIFVHPDILNLKGLGAALALSISVLLVLSLSIFYSNKIIRFSFLKSYKQIFFNLLFAMAGLTIYSFWIKEINYLYTLLFVFGYIIIFYYIAYLLKTFDNSAWFLIKNATSFSSMKNYILTEINSKK